MECTICKGEKEVWIIPPHKEYPTHQVTCYHCKGTGEEPTSKTQEVKDHE